MGDLLDCSGEPPKVLYKRILRKKRILQKRLPGAHPGGRMRKLIVCAT
jgi:hypothetical protein